jgi:hypothetical protein
MPYISNQNDRREKLRNGEPALTAGELNYQIFYYVKHNEINRGIINAFVEQFLGTNPNYQRYNDMTGTLIRCYVEIKRRLNYDIQMLLDIVGSYNDEIAKYEDTKIISNGDVD